MIPRSGELWRDWSLETGRSLRLKSRHLEEHIIANSRFQTRPFGGLRAKMALDVEIERQIGVGSVKR